MAALAASAPFAIAKSKKPAPPPPKDEIQVVGHIAVPDGPVRRFLSTQHYSSVYLYAERDAGKNVILIDVTKADRPAVLADVAYPNGASDTLAVVAGTAALVGAGPAAASSSVPQTLRIMDFSDPTVPKVAREFTGVTAMARDERRSLIFIANSDGIWILRQQLAEDPEVEKAYENYVNYLR